MAEENFEWVQQIDLSKELESIGGEELQFALSLF